MLPLMLYVDHFLELYPAFNVVFGLFSSVCLQLFLEFGNSQAFHSMVSSSQEKKVDM